MKADQEWINAAIDRGDTPIHGCDAWYCGLPPAVLSANGGFLCLRHYNEFIAKVAKQINPTEADIGRKVIYRTAPDFEPQEGVMTSFTDRFVFVRYGNSTTAQATCREDLEWANPEPVAGIGAMLGGR